MDLHAALQHAQEQQAATVVGLQIHGRTIEIYRPRFSNVEGQCRVEYHEGQLFQNGYEQSTFNRDQIPGDALDLDYFVAPVSEEELDSIFGQQGEVVVHRLLEGAPDPQKCCSPRDKAAFTSWCISTLAERNG